MGYQHRPTQGPLLTVEQARRRNAELRIELGQLEAENARLESLAVTMRLQVTTARAKLTRQIRELDAARAQVDLIAAASTVKSDMPEPIYGGLEGLQAAADEMKAYEGKSGKLGTVPRKPPRHGTRRMYATGCGCVECLAWRANRTAAERTTQNRRRAERMAA